MNANLELVRQVSVLVLHQSGCPSCGSKEGSSKCCDGKTMVWMCSTCGKCCCALMHGTRKVTIGTGDLQPKRRARPFRDILSRQPIDRRPKDGGEFFKPLNRFGYAYSACFVCGEYIMDEKGDPWLNEMSAIMRSWEASGRVIAMFQRSSAKLDEAARELGQIVVDIGACEQHYSNLIKLYDLTRIGIITTGDIKEACR